MAEETLPPGTYEAADKAWSNWPGVSDSERDELEAALIAAAPLIRAAERERLDRKARNECEADLYAAIADLFEEPGVTPAHRAALNSRKGPDGSNEISPSAVAALTAEHAARQAGTTQATARREAARLIRCMDTRDTAGAEAIIARLHGECDISAVTDWVWRIEAHRAARRSHDAAVMAWRAAHRAAVARRLGPLREVIAVLAVAMAEPAERPAPLRAAAEADALLAELVAVLAEAMGYRSGQPEGGRRAA